jgi:AraC family transcriptional regulator
MDDARLSRFPHLTWMPLFLRVPSGRRRLIVQMRGTTCGVSLKLNGSCSSSRVTHGQQKDWTESEGAVSCVPADDQQHTYLVTSALGCDVFVVLIPEGHLKAFVASEGVEASAEWSPLLGIQDAVMSDSMSRLAAAFTSYDMAGDVGIDEVARRLVLRLVELNGSGKPDWHDDASVFDRRTLLNFVAYLDEHLRIAPSLSDMAVIAGVSPSHFAKKFRQSSGLSLNRFVNRRRILRSMDSLKKNDASLASIALDLGFSSQSHFTRLFSGLTGMTPAKFQKSVQRTVG